MNCNPIPEREDWFITDRKPTICPRCGKKEVRKAVVGYPLEEDWNNDGFICSAVFLIFLLIGLGVVDNVMLHFSKIPQEIKLLLVV